MWPVAPVAGVTTFPAMSLTTTLSHAQLRNHFHACAFVTGPAEERAVIDPFFVEGMQSRREGGLHRRSRAPRRARGAPARPRAPAPDLLEVTTWNEAHLKGGSFDQDRDDGRARGLIREHAATGRPPMRLVGQMGWVFSSPPGIEQLVAYEASVNEVLNRGKTPTVCVYDVRRLSGSMMMDLLRAHPLTVMNGVLHENPFYTPAEEMLRELQQRRAIADGCLRPAEPPGERTGTTSSLHPRSRGAERAAVDVRRPDARGGARHRDRRAADGARVRARLSRAAGQLRRGARRRFAARR